MTLSESDASGSGLITLAQYCTLNHLMHTLDNQCTLCVSYVGISHIFYTYQGPTAGYWVTVSVLYWVGALGYYSNDLRMKASGLDFGPITVAWMWRVVFTRLWSPQLFLSTSPVRMCTQVQTNLIPLTSIVVLGKENRLQVHSHVSGV